MQFGKIALKGAMVTGIAQAVKMVIRMASVVVLARLLVPEDFGLVASVAPLVAFAMLFQELGLRQAVVQRKEIGQAEFNRVFWLTALAGTCCMFLVILMSPLVAMFYDDPRLRGVTIMAAFPVLVASMSVLHLGLLGRRMQFGHLALNEVLGSAGALLTSILGALSGLGYWSILLGMLAEALVMLTAAWCVTRWRPGRPDLRLNKDMMSFGANLTGFQLVNFLRRNADNILIGKYAGAVDLGYYDRAYKLLLFPMQSINNPLGRVIIPILSRFQDEKPRLRAAYLRITGLLAFSIIPPVAAVASCAHEVIDLLFGAGWEPVAEIFYWLGIAGLVQPIGNSSGWIFVSQARTKEMLRFGVFTSIVTLAAFCMGLPWGVLGIAVGYAVASLVVQPVRWVYLGRIGPVTAMDFVKLQVPFLVSAGLVYIVSDYMRSDLELSGVRLIGVSVLISYLVSAACFSMSALGRNTLFFIFSKVRFGAFGKT